MGWGNCGEDSQGRPIGYLFPATCDHPGCTKHIHRGIAYICGREMHGDDEFSCEKYFCEEHTRMVRVDENDEWRQVCHSCAEVFEAEISQLDNDEKEFLSDT